MTKFRPGDKVFAPASKTFASLCVVKETDLAHIPNGLQVETAAALPTVTLTGSQLAALSLCQPPKGTVLVTGAAGNVGRSAVFTANEEAVRNLEPLDAVADTVNGRTAELLIGKVKPGGIFASVLGPPANASAHPNVTVKVMQVTPDAKMLVHMAEVVRDGKLSIPVGQKFPLSSANKAHAEAEQGRGGKILLLA